MHKIKKLKIIFTAIIITGSIILTSCIQQQDKKHWEAPESAVAQKNPFAENIAATQKGKILFENQCIMCHGSKGKGDGPVAASLNPKPADLTAEMTQSHTDGALYWKIMQGSTPMPSFKEAHKTDHDQCWQLINYISELGKQS
jgi:mono/diheme cytochrome c family protein